MLGCMKTFNSAEAHAEWTASEVRAQMARQGKSRADLAALLGVTPQTAGRRTSGAVPFDVIELSMVADWLGVPATSLILDGIGSDAA